MKQSYSLKIDAFSHVTPAKYLEALSKASSKAGAQKVAPTQPLSQPLYDLEYRFRIMDRYDGLVQVLTLGFPAIEEVADSEKVVDLESVFGEIVSYSTWRLVSKRLTLPLSTGVAGKCDVSVSDFSY